ncbi:glycosyltransferase family 4 protein [Demequina iriomotensis]|uniref:glycosyltransferase family 4 protein n=1 Tax=Demequina iriomotensis TaxID=1536641 RepID=UPI00078546C3|nr:glycosyltransferase family 4 protein [Demequina iriomotensis]
MKDGLKVTFVDHSGALGGGQLALAQYLDLPSDLERSAVILQDGPLTARLRAAHHDVVTLGPGTGRASAIRRARALRDALDALAPDVVVANSLRAALALRLSRSRVRPRLCLLRIGFTRAAMPGWRKALYTRLVLPGFDAVLANSEWSASTVPASLAHVPLEVTYSVSGSRRVEGNGASSPFTGDRELRVLSLNRVAPWKGIHVAIEAIARLRAQHSGVRVSLRVAGAPQFGEEDYLRDITARAAASDGTVDLVGHVDDIAPALEWADVVLSTSIDPEPYGQTVVQALCAGRPVVVTDQGGPAEIVRRVGGGLLVPAGDADALAQALGSLVRDPARLAQLREETAHAPAVYGDDAVVSRLERAIRASLQQTFDGAAR